jgi:uncharacterized membrane protein YqgA involved in biofilm formation
VFRGAGTVLNVTTVLIGSGIGVLLGNRLPGRTREVVTDGLGLVTLLVAATSAASVLDPDLADAVGTSAPVLIVLGSVLIGGICGSRTGWRGWATRSGAGSRTGVAATGTASSRGSSPPRWCSASAR